MILYEGTGNGMAKSLLDSIGDPCTVPNAVLAIIRGFKFSIHCHLNLSYLDQYEFFFQRADEKY